MITRAKGKSEKFWIVFAIHLKTKYYSPPAHRPFFPENEKKNRVSIAEGLDSSADTVWRMRDNGKNARYYAAAAAARRRCRVVKIYGTARACARGFYVIHYYYILFYARALPWRRTRCGVTRRRRIRLGALPVCVCVCVCARFMRPRRREGGGGRTCSRKNVFPSPPPRAGTEPKGPVRRKRASLFFRLYRRRRRRRRNDSRVWYIIVCMCVCVCVRIIKRCVLHYYYYSSDICGGRLLRR